MKGLNNLHFNTYVDFIFEFVPQIIFMLALFGYMDLLIIVKWLTPWEGNTAVAPSIISTMIGMFLHSGELPANTQPLIYNQSYQEGLHNSLVLVCLICVPIMLLVKPLWFLYSHPSEEHEKKEGHKAILDDSDNEDQIEMSEHSNKDKPPKDDAGANEDKPKQKEQKNNAKDEEEKDKKEMDESIHDLLDHVESSEEKAHDFSEVFIHQLIETIEFVLGTISNTASYLRLWALSLAHSQLAEVFYEKLVGGIALEANHGKGSSVLLFLLFPAFFSFTFFVLMCMDAMECFLHCLRLHWVEFQNKFYKGNGYKFAPFSYEKVLTTYDEKE